MYSAYTMTSLTAPGSNARLSLLPPAGLFVLLPGSSIHDPCVGLKQSECLEDSSCVWCRGTYVKDACFSEVRDGWAL